MADRKSELLQVARALIAKKGLADVTTNHIAQAAGISRGTLYHHFESKEAILDALVEKISAEQYERARLTAQDSTKPARERLLRTIMSLNVGTGPDTAILEHLNSPKNIVLHQKIEREMLAILPSILAPIVEDGNREGVFNTPFAYETMEMLVSYVLLVLDGGPDLDETESTRKLAALVTNVERMLGAKEGTLSELLAQIAPPPPNPSSGS
ncbi:MAG: TetR/AcrR family transcriptional regulator [Actinomycetaceae bacterium]|nr:TetR/AcrR family transcriptional regulator [Actinomycetaceae bacterium]